MLSSVVIIFAATLGAHAVVAPGEPSPGSVFREGDMCHIAWTGDSESPTAWKDMTITLRTGNNFEMQTITQVADSQDGTVDGVFDYPCPDVTPQSAIYFYQFDAPGATEDGPQWTTRFTIAAENGDTTPPTEALQPNGDEIPWGVGTLESGEPSLVVPASSELQASPPPSSSSVEVQIAPPSTTSTPTRFISSASPATTEAAETAAETAAPTGAVSDDTNVGFKTHGSISIFKTLLVLGGMATALMVGV